MSRSKGGGRAFVHRDYKGFVKAAEAAGWTIKKTGKGHPRLCPPRGARRPDGELAIPVTLPSTPGSGRSVANKLADLRKQGLDV